MKAILGLLLLAAAVSAGPTKRGVIELCPTNEILDTPIHLEGLYALPPPGGFVQYINNLLIYNAESSNIMSGDPEGPWFLPEPGCLWTLNGPLNCPVKLFSDSAYTDQIGTGTVTSPMLAFNSVNRIVSGDLFLTTSFEPGYDPDAEHVGVPAHKLVNFRPTTNKHLTCRATREFPPTNNPPETIANALTHDGTQWILTLWCSNGYNNVTGEFEAANAGTAFDFRAPLNCTNITNCIPHCPELTCGSDGCGGRCVCPENTFCARDFTCIDRNIPPCPCPNVRLVSRDCLTIGGGVDQTVPDQTCVRIEFVEGSIADYPCH